MNISIAIADTDRTYLERLGEVLQGYKELTVSIFTKAGALEQALQSRRFDIVLFDPDISEQRLLLSARLAICLYRDDARNNSLYSDCRKVLKYQRISRIYKEVIKAYADEAGDGADFDHACRSEVIAVYSPVGGSGKTTVAFALAGRFAALGREALLLNLEQLDSSACLHPHTEDGITALVEAVEEHKNYELKLKGILKKGQNGISYVEGFERIVDYNTVTKEEISEVLDKIRRCGICDVLVVDMGSHMDGIGLAVFDLADSIVIVEKPGEFPVQKMELFARQALAAEYAPKMYRIRNFMENHAHYSDALDIQDIGSIRNYGRQSVKNMLHAISANEMLVVDRLLS